MEEQLAAAHYSVSDNIPPFDFKQDQIMCFAFKNYLSKSIKSEASKIMGLDRIDF